MGSMPGADNVRAASVGNLPHSPIRASSGRLVLISANLHDVSIQFSSDVSLHIKYVCKCD